MKLHAISYAAVAAALSTSAAAAQQQPAPAAAQSKADDRADADPDEDQAIVVTGSALATGDLLGNVSVLDSEELVHDLTPSLGDTLRDMPGVSSTGFGPSASRPILRGEQGDRAPVLIDGVSTLDLSPSDPDVAVTINPITADRIEVLHGPAVLLYTGSVNAGVVNVIDSRIPRSAPRDTKGNLLLNYGTAANERSGNAGVDVPLGGNFVAHADAAYSKYDDLHVGGYLLSDPLRREALASADPDVRALAGLKDTLPNTAGRARDIAAGVAYATGDSNMGVSLSHHDARYGVPVRWSLTAPVEPEKPTIDAGQDRADARANLPLGGLFKLFEFRGGVSKYHHAELEADGSVASRFASNGGEARADLVQAERAGWGGTTGVDYLAQDARIKGDEKFLPDSRKHDLALFTVQTIDRGPLRFEGGLRLEFARLHANRDETIAEIGDELRSEGEMDDVPPIGEAPIARSFTPLSAAVGANYDIGGGLRAGLSLSHSERAPSLDELFSLGPHGGSQQFLIGDPDLGLERSNGVELGLHRTTGPVQLQASLYYSRFSNFIYQAPTDEIEDRLPVYENRQGRAVYYGFEAESDFSMGKAFGIVWSGELTADAIRAKIRRFGNAPEIPPFRILAGLGGRRGRLDGRIEVERVSAQDKVAPNETSTPGYTMVNLSLDWRALAASNRALTLSLTANNLFDVNARSATSDLKDYAPLAGRDIRLTARVGF